MADFEKQQRQQDQDPISPTSSPSSPTDADSIDLEKAETIHPIPSSATGRSATRLRSIRSVVTDGYSVYNVDEEGDDVDEYDPVTAQRTKTKTDPYEVRWDGPADPANPRNFHLAQKWTAVLITSVGSFCVYVSSSLPGPAPNELFRSKKF